MISKDSLRTELTELLNRELEGKPFNSKTIAIARNILCARFDELREHGLIQTAPQFSVGYLDHALVVSFHDDEEAKK